MDILEKIRLKERYGTIMEENLTMEDFSKELEESYKTMNNRTAVITDDMDPMWTVAQEYLEEKTVLTLKIAGIVKGGVIVNVETLRGFVPASKLSLTYIEDLNEWLGKKIKLQVITVDPEAKKLVLSARDLLLAEAATKRQEQLDLVKVGAVLEGTVDSLKDFGAFVKLSNGLSGLVHISQISINRIKSPSAVLSVGDAVTVKVIAIKDGKLSLSIKALVEPEESEVVVEEAFELPEVGEATTNLGSLFANLKFE